MLPCKNNISQGIINKQLVSELDKLAITDADESFCVRIRRVGLTTMKPSPKMK